MDPHDLGGYGMEMAKEITGGNLDGQMSVHPNGFFQIERDSRFTNIVSLRLFRKRFPIGISAFDEQFRFFFCPNCASDFRHEHTSNNKGLVLNLSFRRIMGGQLVGANV